MHKLSLVLLMSFFMVPVGCGGPAEPAKVAVSGKLVSKDKVDFLGMGVAFTLDKSSVSGNAVVNADGTFSGMAPVGAVSACLYGAGAAAPGAAHADATLTKTNPVYWDAGNSPWKITIPAEGKKDIELTIEAKK